MVPPQKRLVAICPLASSRDPDTTPTANPASSARVLSKWCLPVEAMQLQDTLATTGQELSMPINHREDLDCCTTVSGPPPIFAAAGEAISNKGGDGDNILDQQSNTGSTCLPSPSNNSAFPLQEQETPALDLTFSIAAPPLTATPRQQRRRLRRQQRRQRQRGLVPPPQGGQDAAHHNGAVVGQQRGRQRRHRQRVRRQRRRRHAPRAAALAAQRVHAAVQQRVQRHEHVNALVDAEPPSRGRVRVAAVSGACLQHCPPRRQRYEGPSGASRQHCSTAALLTWRPARNATISGTHAAAARGARGNGSWHAVHKITMSRA
eukprot:TRINITY_DN5787_c0_g1_i1.p1 TRINITY_DN5787_c0_g1~~TRINITY_DN5787_c0_g1_i1.p1  ORF type:complete len:319 (+),score=60.05 TRINITY_DN5787_c0_g1_i1:254-1210(+)